MSEANPAGPADPAPQERPAPRVGDRERHAMLDRLSAAYAEGRLTPEEFEERTTAALAARTEADLMVLVADLPEAAPSAQPVVSGRRPDSRLVAVMSGVERRGRWVAAPQINAVAVMGGVHIDFRGAAVGGREVHLAAVAVMGGIEIVVPDDWSVSMSGLSFMGGRSVRGEPSMASPAVHLEISGLAVMGGVDVRYASRRAKLP